MMYEHRADRKPRGRLGPRDGSRYQAIFDRLHALELDGRSSDERLRATLTDQDKRILPTLRTITEGVAASAIWHALIKMIAAL